MAALKKRATDITRDLETRVTGLKEQLKALVKSLPTITGVTRLNANPRCGVVSSSTITKHGGILSAGYYLNAEMDEDLVRIIDATPMEKLGSVIESILTKGSFPLKRGGNGRIHPEALEALRKSWDDQRNWEV